MFEHLLQRAANLQQTGKPDEAARIYRDILRANPADIDALAALAQLAMRNGAFEEAQLLLADALKPAAKFAGALQLRGAALMHLKRFPEALLCFEQARALAPEPVEMTVNRATILGELNRLDEALTAFDTALAAEPRHIIAWNNRGNTLAAMKRLEEALECYEKALAIDVNFVGAKENREMALFQLRRMDRMPAGVARKLFDGFSSHYDTTMLEKLGYRAHLHLRTLAGRVMPDMAPPLRILDLGSGTGLVGDAFKDLAVGGRLDGIDLSPLMNETAAKRGIYDELILGDLETFLAKPGPAYDLMLAADTMIYIGDLGPTLSGAAKRLNPGGWYLFAGESKAGEGWEHTSAARFRHSESYLRAEAARWGLELVDIMSCTLRNELDQPVAGFAVGLRKPAS